MTPTMQAVLKLRRENEKVRAALDAVDNDALPPEDLKREAALLAQRWAQEDDSNGYALLGMTAPDGRARAEAGRNLLVATSGGQDASGIINRLPVPVGPALTWLLGAAKVTELLHAKIDTLNYEAGPALADRPAVKANLAKQLMKLEREEETLIRKAEEAGEEIPRRHNAAPEVVLDYNADGEMPDLGLLPRTYARTGAANAAARGAQSGQAGAQAAPAMAANSFPAPNMGTLHQNVMGAAVNRARGRG